MTRSQTRSQSPPITTTTHPDPHTDLMFVLAAAVRDARCVKQTDSGLPRGAAVVDTHDSRFLLITDTSDAGHLRDVFVAYAPTHSVLVKPHLYEAAAWVRQVLNADDPMAAAGTDAPVR
jgi:hypothetical protein